MTQIDLETVRELVAQAESRTEVLSVEVDRATQQVAQLDQQIATLHTALSSTQADVEQRFDAFKSVLNVSEQMLEEHLETAKQQLEAFHERVGALNNHVETIADEMKHQLDELKNHAESMLTEIEAETETIHTQLDELTQNIQASDTKVITHGETIYQGIDIFREAVYTARAAFEEKQTELLTQLESLETELQEQVEQIAGAFDTLMEEGDHTVRSLGETLTSTSHDVMEGIQQQFIEDIQGNVSTAFEELEGAMTVLSDLGEASEALLGGKLGGAIDGIGDVLEVIDPVLGVLDTVQKLLG